MSRREGKLKALLAQSMPEQEWGGRREGQAGGRAIRSTAHHTHTCPLADKKECRQKGGGEKPAANIPPTLRREGKHAHWSMREGEEKGREAGSTECSRLYQHVKGKRREGRLAAQNAVDSISM